MPALAPLSGESRKTPSSSVVPDAASTRHLVRLAQEKHVVIEHEPALPYHAVGIIRSHRPGATP